MRAVRVGEQRQRRQAQGGRGPLIEHRTFRLAAGTDEATFVAEDARFQCDVAYQQPGIARRTLARGEDGAWLVETLWWTAEHAEAAVHADDALAALIDPGSITVRRWDEDFPR